MRTGISARPRRANSVAASLAVPSPRKARMAALDLFITKQRQNKTPQPGNLQNLEALASTLNFVRVDPRIAYASKIHPLMYDARWLDSKRAEIDARPRRKAHFGKVLTPTMVKERHAKGWGTHQNREVPFAIQERGKKQDGEGNGSASASNRKTGKGKVKTTENPMGDLFDLPDKLEPVLVSGGIAMADATPSALGRSKRKAARRIWLVPKGGDDDKEMNWIRKTYVA